MSLTSYRTLGRSGLRVSPLAFGAMNFDDGSWGSAPETSFALLDHYLEAGGNFVDTANIYNKGASEETLGHYFDQRPGARDRMVLATKFGGSMAAEVLAKLLCVLEETKQWFLGILELLHVGQEAACLHRVEKAARRLLTPFRKCFRCG